MGAKRRSDTWLWLIGIVGLILYFVFSWQDLFAAQEWKMLSREEVIVKAKENWKQQGVDLSKLKVSAVMESEPNLDGYLGKEDLREEFDQEAPATAPVSYWHVTFYSPKARGDLNYETYHDLKSGSLLGFFQPLLDTNTEIEERDAKLRAENALKALGVDLSRMSFEGSDEERMLDEAEVLEGDEEYRSNYYSFMWRDTKYHAGDSQLFYYVDINGGQVTNVYSGYYVPEEFVSWFDKQTLYATILTVVSMLGSFLLLIFAFVFLFLIQQKRPYWPSLWLSLLVMILYAVSNLNSWPVTEAQGLTEGGAFGVVIAGIFALVLMIFLSVLAGVGNYPLTMTGGMLVREVNPRLWISRKDPDWPDRMRSAAKRGYLLAFAWMGFQGVFYFLGENYFGVWYENDLSMSPGNMWIPALFPLLAWLAGISEEIAYRLFGVTFLKRYLKFSFLAVLLPAMIWALGHTLYPIYPIYTRFIELTIMGVIIGYCYLYWGLETVIFAHVAFDTVLMCIPLFLSGEPVQVISGVGFLILPLVVGYGIALLKPRRQQLDFV